jgi:hypothetical protein
MAGRPGDWAALGEAADPVTTQPDAVAELAKFYRDMADAMEKTAGTLQKVADGDESVGKGESVEKIRGTAKDVTGSLHQMTGRYRAAGDAMQGFHDAVGETSDRSGGSIMALTWQALEDAVTAQGDLSSARGLPDPAADAKAAGKDPTADDTSDSAKRVSRISDGEGAVSAAKAKLRAAMDQLSDAGKTAADRMRGAWDDGLHDSGWYKFIHMLIKILTIIGMVLAVFAILIPGLGIGAILGAIGAAMTLVAQVATFAMGEGNVFDLVMAVVGVLTLGIGAGITKATSMAVSKGISVGKTAITKGLTTDLGKIAKLRNDAIAGWLDKSKSLDDAFGELKMADNLDGAVTQVAIKRIEEFTGKFKDNPNWWNIPKIGTTLKNDWATVSKQFGSDLFTKGGFTGWAERLGGIDGQINRSGINKWLGENGLSKVGSDAPGWHSWVNGGASVWGKGVFLSGLVLYPIGIGADQSRPWSDWVNEHKHPVPNP